MKRPNPDAGQRGLAKARLAKVARRSTMILPAVLLGACATTSSEQKAFFAEQASRMQSSGVSVIADGCVYRDEVGTSNYVLRQASEDVGKAAAASVAGVVTSLGHAPLVTETPFVCGGSLSWLKPDENGKTSVAESKAEAPHPETLPLPIDDSVQHIPGLADAYRALLDKAENANLETAEGGSVPASQPLGLSDADVQLLKAAAKTSNIWVVRASGAQVSMGKTIGTAVLTSVLTLGTAAMTVGDGHGYDIALVDLDRNQIIWTRHMSKQPGDPAKPAFYGYAWARQTLTPFLGDAKASSPTVATSDAGTAGAMPAAPTGTTGANAASAAASSNGPDGAIAWKPGPSGK